MTLQILYQSHITMMSSLIEVYNIYLFYTSNFIQANISSGANKEQTSTESWLVKKLKHHRWKKRKSFKNKEHRLDGSERKKRSKQSKKHMKSEEMMDKRRLHQEMVEAN